jgi:CHAT domain-containing protein/tetratricopeptide (TPR) repeat protein
MPTLGAVRRLAIFVLVSLCAAFAAQAQQAEWDRLDKETSSLYRQGHYDQAMASATKALRVAEDTFGHDHPYVAVSLNSLAALYKTQSQYAQAESAFKRALAIWEKNLGPEHPGVALGLNNLAALYADQGQYALADPLYTRSLAIREKALGPDNFEVAVSLNNLAELYRTQAKHAMAEPLFKRALAIWEKGGSPDHPAVAAGLNNLALLYKTRGQYELAEPLFKRSLAIKEKVFGLEHPDVALSLNNLAGLYEAQSQYALAASLDRRSLAINEKVFGPDHPSVALSLNNIAGLYKTQGQYAQAMPLYERSLAIWGKALGPDHPEVARSLNNLASLYQAQGQYAKAEPLYKRSLAIWEKALGFDHPDVAASLNNLAALYDVQENYTQAAPLYKRALAIWEKSLGPEHPLVAESLNNLTSSYLLQGLYVPALSSLRRASAIYRQRIVAGGTGDAAAREASKNRSGFLFHLSLLARNPGQEPLDKITDEAFQIVQLEQASGTASAIAKMASRFASGDDTLASLIKRKQDASDHRAKAESQLVATSSKPPQERKVEGEQQLRNDVALAVKEIESIDGELTRGFPEYQELTRPEPVTVSRVRALLKSGEAMLVYSLSKSSFLWVVKPDGAVFMPLQANIKDVAAKVATVRAGMESDGAGNAPRASVGILYELYQNIFAPALSHLVGVKHVLIVPAGPLQSLPFSMLVASSPPEIGSDIDYRRVDWLARHFALSVLPSVSSIQAFRQFAKASTSQEPFVGFGDPLIGGADSRTRGRRAKLDVAAVFRSSTVKSIAPAASAATSASASEIADVEAIRNAPRLAETADELRAMGKTLKAGPDAIWLQESATETRVKGLDLSKYRTIAFATHGVMAGEIKGVGESGLILTPPKQGTVEDDGYLSASEVAKLKLNADWVVLSACNTAAADGTPGAEGLSGLAKAFFYAGARSLLVSHWPVDSDATVQLTTTMLSEYEAHPGQGKAEAHRKAMMTLMATPDQPEYAHPKFWAPFVVVGEGGAGSGAKGAQ